MGAMVVKAVNGVLKGRKTMRAATVAADVCNSRYMCSPDWRFGCFFDWRGQRVQAQFSHKDSLSVISMFDYGQKHDHES